MCVMISGMTSTCVSVVLCSQSKVVPVSQSEVLR